MEFKRQITEYLDIDLEKEMWCCNKCGYELISARKNYKKGCLVYDRDPTTVHPPYVSGDYTFSPDPTWCRIVEFYCPGCYTLLEVEAVPPGYPIVHDFQPDLETFYREWLEGFDLCPVLTIRTHDLDFVHQPEHLNVVVKRIQDRLAGREELVFD